jgi:hypothetical protein
MFRWEGSTSRTLRSFVSARLLPSSGRRGSSSGLGRALSEEYTSRPIPATVRDCGRRVEYLMPVYARVASASTSLCLCACPQVRRASERKADARRGSCGCSAVRWNALALQRGGDVNGADNLKERRTGHVQPSAVHHEEYLGRCQPQVGGAEPDFIDQLGATSMGAFELYLDLAQLRRGRKGNRSFSSRRWWST